MRTCPTLSLKSTLVKISATFGCLLCLAYSLGSTAEVIQVPVASQAESLQNIERPKLGTKHTDVIEKFGEPIATRAAVGDPPIARWEYQDYYVFFEYDRVLHTVLKHRPVNDDQPVNDEK